MEVPTTLCIGIDLGTSNSTVCVASPDTAEPLRTVPLRQVQGPGVIMTDPLLPSVLYLPTEAEASSSSFSLPWSTFSTEPVIGRFAREQEARTPDRVIRSAKSWLCNPAIDRRAPILPWHLGESPSVASHARLSPFDASRQVLEHLRRAAEAWAHEEGLGASMRTVSPVVTVPASFDEVARQLTHDAAIAAGFPSCTLLEEPQAAFYAWLSHHENDWRHLVKPGDTLLVCDVGGGTADFSLIAVLEINGELSLSRIAVGDHILLGGDNMDLALAYRARAGLPAGSPSLDAWQMGVLTYGAQLAKERLLSDDALASYPISIPSRGSNLFAAPLEATLTRADIDAVILEGFFPEVERTAAPLHRKAASLTDFGLPYASDPALTKHLAAFLARSGALINQNPELSALRERASDGFVRPSAVLFNGGVFSSDKLRSRVVNLLRSWSAPFPVEELHGIDRSQAVSLGAAWYARLKSSGKGVRVRSATTKSFYIGVESAMPAIPGFIPPLKGVCIAPRGSRRGTISNFPQRPSLWQPERRCSFGSSQAPIAPTIPQGRRSPMPRPRSMNLSQSARRLPAIRAMTRRRHFPCRYPFGSTPGLPNLVFSRSRFTKPPGPKRGVYRFAPARSTRDRTSLAIDIVRVIVVFCVTNGIIALLRRYRSRHHQLCPRLPRYPRRGCILHSASHSPTVH